MDFVGCLDSHHLIGMFRSYRRHFGCSFHLNVNLIAHVELDSMERHAEPNGMSLRQPENAIILII